ncbi:anthrone oxygenase family protein [Halovulum sp. GXIMD14794]
MRYALSLVALLLSGAIFGFFYAWVCSTMWGLDAADPKVAIAAMQAMNASVRNTVFAPAFFATGPALAAAALAWWACGQRAVAALFGLAAAVYLLGGMGLTLAINVPMNEALAAVTVPQDPAEAARIWDDYSADWQFWNQIRTATSGLALLFAGAAMLRAR